MEGRKYTTGGVCGEAGASRRLSGVERWGGGDEPCERVDQAVPSLGSEKEEKNQRTSDRQSRKRDQEAVKTARAAVLQQNEKVRFFVVGPVIPENAPNFVKTLCESSNQGATDAGGEGVLQPRKLLVLFAVLLVSRYSCLVLYKILLRIARTEHDALFSQEEIYPRPNPHVRVPCILYPQPFL